MAEQQSGNRMTQEYTIVNAKRKDIIFAEYDEVSEAARKNLDGISNPDQVFMLQVGINSPKKILKALLPSDQNLVEISKID